MNVSDVRCLIFRHSAHDQSEQREHEEANLDQSCPEQGCVSIVAFRHLHDERPPVRLMNVSDTLVPQHDDQSKQRDHDGANLG